MAPSPPPQKRMQVNLLNVHYFYLRKEIVLQLRVFQTFFITIYCNKFCLIKFSVKIQKHTKCIHSSHLALCIKVGWLVCCNLCCQMHKHFSFPLWAALQHAHIHTFPAISPPKLGNCVNHFIKQKPISTTHLSRSVHLLLTCACHHLSKTVQMSDYLPLNAQLVFQELLSARILLSFLTRRCHFSDIF